VAPVNGLSRVDARSEQRLALALHLARFSHDE
jgi:hypothetical protein